MKYGFIASVLVLTFFIVGCMLLPQPAPIAPREALFKSIDRIIDLLEKRKFAAFVDECIDPQAFAKLLESEGWRTKQQFIDAMDNEFDNDFGDYEFLIGTFYCLRDKEPTFKKNGTRATISGHYLYPWVDFIRKGNTWTWCPR